MSRKGNTTNGAPAANSGAKYSPEMDALRAELSRELRAMRDILTKDLLDVVQQYIDDTVATAVDNAVANAVAAAMSKHKAAATPTDETIAKLTTDIKKLETAVAATATTSSALALTTAQSQELTIAATNRAHQMIMADIGRTIVPRIRALSEAVAYHTQDTGELVTDYRRAVMAQSDDTSRLAITDGSGASASSAPRWSGGNVGILWGENESGL